MNNYVPLKSRDDFITNEEYIEYLTLFAAGGDNEALAELLHFRKLLQPLKEDEVFEFYKRCGLIANLAVQGIYPSMWQKQNILDHLKNLNERGILDDNYYQKMKRDFEIMPTE